MIEKIVSKASILIPRAMAGDPVAISLLALAGIVAVGNMVSDRKP